MDDQHTKTKLNKYIALSGICGRNQAAEWIKAGFVKVNDKVVKEPFVEVKDDDIVTVKNKQVKPKIIYTNYVMNKPWHTPVEPSDGGKSTDIYNLLAKQTDKSLNVLGKPDADTCGLIVFTDDKPLTEKLNIPGHQLKTVYEATLDKPWDTAHFDLHIYRETIKFKGINIIDQDDKTVIGIEVVGGLYQEVKSYFEEKGYVVKKLDCTFFGGITKKDLKRGWSRALTEKEVVFIKHFT